MNDYVVGFAFSESRNWILLASKLRPQWQKGFLNGIGGKIEKGESPIEAMNRETLEETGLSLDWEQKGILEGTNNDGEPFKCHIFYSYSNEIFKYQQIEDEPLLVEPVGYILKFPMISNLKFLIPFGIHGSEKEFIKVQYK